ncbi:xanthine dehydrogenase, putative [Bodo saltans]|uniref:Xanthine dehydrogenase, putative n=1 Tax=Bodo saltans TaxID=75058 RepID=A0A0S4JXG7_BODSA|nr:xanthine dehydrogenase, putative [Bodo saltans]|eukprot:CUG93277.1 xanthine dehydrogenase, putative [Bodo saltans]
MGASDNLQFAVNGTLVTLDTHQVPANLKLATYLRDHLYLRGTKVGCGEGGCGACSVLISRWDADIRRVVTISANACLRPVATLHGCMVTTVEGIGSPCLNGGRFQKAPHIVQQRFQQLNASQCGFCTPGFVVSVYGQLAKNPNSTMVDMEQALDGNLCRCTGYRPILDAAKSFAVDSDVVDTIGGTELTPAATGNDINNVSHGTKVQEEIDAMFPDQLKNLDALWAAGDRDTTTFTSTSNSKNIYIRAHTVEGAVSAARQYAAVEDKSSTTTESSKVAFVVSQTSAGVYKDHLPHKNVLIDVGHIPSLNSVTHSSQGLRVGAAVAISKFLGALVDPSVYRTQDTVAKFSSIVSVVSKIANVHVRDVASIGGNLLMAKNLYQPRVSTQLLRTRTARRRSHQRSRLWCLKHPPECTKITFLTRKYLIDVGHIPSLNSVTHSSQGLRVGAAIAISKFLGALVDPSVDRTQDTVAKFSSIVSVVSKIANVHVRDVASIGGNLLMAKNLGFASDLATPLCAAGARVVIVPIFPTTNELVGDSNNRIVLPLIEFLATPEESTAYLLGGDRARVVIVPIIFPTTNELVGDSHNNRIVLPLIEFDATPEVSTAYLLEAIEIPYATTTEVGKREVFFCTRQAIRVINAHAILNAAFSATVVVTEDDKKKSIIDWLQHRHKPRRPDLLQRPFLRGRRFHDAENYLQTFSHNEGEYLIAALLHDEQRSFSHQHERIDAFVHGPYKRSHRKALVHVFISKFVEHLAASLANDATPSQLQAPPPLHTGHPTFTKPTNLNEWAPIGEAIPRHDGIDHASGTAVYVSDIKEARDALYCAWVLSTIPKGTVSSIPVHLLANLEGNPKFFGPKDFPAGTRNESSSLVARLFPVPNPAIKEHYPLLAVDVTFAGQTIGVVYADSQQAALAAAKLLTQFTTYVNIEKNPVITAADALAANKAKLGGVGGGGDIDYVFQARELIVGEPNKFAPRQIKDEEATGVPTTATSEEPTNIQSGEEVQHATFYVDMATQKHFYMETHAAYVVPHETHLAIHVSTQAPQMTAPNIAHVLGRPLHEIRMLQYRTGGAFGGKIVTDHASVAAVIASKENRAVKFYLDRHTDMRVTGGRQETEASCRVDFTNTGEILGFDVDTTKNCGDRYDWSAATVTLLVPNHIGSLYRLPNRKIVSTGLRTHTVPRSAVRAPGEIEAAFITEEAIERTACALNVHSQVIRERNFRTEPRPNERIELFTFPKLYKSLMNEGGWQKRLSNSHTSSPCSCYSYSNRRERFYLESNATTATTTKTPPKLIPLSRFRSAGNDSGVLPLGGLSGGSTASESNVQAVVIAARVLVDRLRPIAQALPEEQRRDWSAIVAAAAKAGVELSATGKTDPARNPLNYGVYLAAGAEVSLDVRTGTVTILRVDMKYDGARSLNPAVDIGQAEGAFLFGVGYMLLEDSPLDKDNGGQQHHDGTWEYKIPTVQDVPIEFHIDLIQNEAFSEGVMSSKASGEPPLCAATCVTSAVRQAIRSARVDAAKGAAPWCDIAIPWTCDKIVAACSINEK